VSTNVNAREALKQLPSVDDLLNQFSKFNQLIPYNLFKSTIQSTLKEFRNEIQNGEKIENIQKSILDTLSVQLESLSQPNLQRVINGTGIILHTGLGRAPISTPILQKAMENISHYSNLELSLSNGKRGERNNHIDALVNSLTGAESTIIVNNNAAAVLLMLNSISDGKEVIISRGQQVEIGGSFRIPDVIQKSGCIPIEVGATNKTHLQDYENAISTNTGAILVAHTSNYKVLGFTKEVDLSELSTLAKKKRIPLLVDLGSGAIADFQEFGLPFEETVDYYIKKGAHLVSFSGDKLLGGPQSGIVCGKKSLIRKLHKNALYRALRTDKLTVSILEQTLKTYISKSEVNDSNLTLLLFKRSQYELEKLGENILEKINPTIRKNHKLTLIKTNVEAGSGSLPLESFPSIAISFDSNIKPSQISSKLRQAKTPVLGYIHGKKFRIDLKAIPNESIDLLVDTINKTL
jgi:L-seryl-tRNA(Ser) seleniumtransferase